MTSWPKGLVARRPFGPHKEWEYHSEERPAPEDTHWFRRFGDVPGVDVQLPRAIDRTTVQGHDAVPVLDAYTLRWSTPQKERLDPDAPCLRRGDDYDPSAGAAPPESVEGVEARLVRVCERLELPGTLRDYVKLLSGGPLMSLPKELVDETSIDAALDLAWMYARTVARWPVVLEKRGGEDGATYAHVAPSAVGIFIREGHTAALAEFVGLLESTGRRFKGLYRDETQVSTQLATFTGHHARLGQLEEQHAA